MGAALAGSVTAQPRLWPGLDAGSALPSAVALPAAAVALPAAIALSAAALPAAVLLAVALPVPVPVVALPVPVLAAALPVPVPEVVPEPVCSAGGGLLVSQYMRDGCAP